ncbi:Hypothetical protein FSTVST1_118 [Faustovirus ST1]|nr:Hypothetical protein FSTVST1_118 [Faustovirus ST1]
MGSDAEFKKETIGYFQFPSGESNIDIRMRVTSFYDVAHLKLDYKAAIIIPTSCVDGTKGVNGRQYNFKKQICDTVKFTPTGEYVLDVRGETSTMMQVNCVLNPNENVVVYANKYKYYAKLTFVNTATKTGHYSPILIIMPKGRNPSILDEIEKLQFESIEKIEVKPKPAAVVATTVVDTNPTVQDLQTEFSFDIKLKKEFYNGVECWKVPSMINKCFEITVDRPISGTKLVTIDKNGKFEAFVLSGNATNSVYIRGDVREFWFAGTDGKLVNVVIKTLVF